MEYSNLESMAGEVGSEVWSPGASENGNSVSSVSPVSSSSDDSMSGSRSPAGIHSNETRNHSISSAPNGHIAISPSMLELRPRDVPASPAVPRAPDDGLQPPPARAHNQDDNDDNISPCSTVAPLGCPPEEDLSPGTTQPSSPLVHSPEDRSPIEQVSTSSNHETSPTLLTEYDAYKGDAIDINYATRRDAAILSCSTSKTTSSTTSDHFCCEEGTQALNNGTEYTDDAACYTRERMLQKYGNLAEKGTKGTTNELKNRDMHPVSGSFQQCMRSCLSELYRHAKVAQSRQDQLISMCMVFFCLTCILIGGFSGVHYPYVVDSPRTGDSVNTTALTWWRTP